MKLEDWVKIHTESGFDISQTNGHYFLHKNRINYSFPELIAMPIDKKLVSLLKWKYPVTVINTGHRIRNTYEYILQTSDYRLETFRKKTRTTIRKSLGCCEFKKPALDDLLQSGIRINRQTLRLQERHDKFLTDPVLWEKYITFCYGHEDVEIIGAYHENKMIGYAIAYRLGDRHYFHLQHIDRDYATFYPMSGLMYTLINQLVARYGRITISDGMESFNPIPSLNRFKRYMGFERVPVTRVYVLHPLIVLFLQPVIWLFVGLMGRRNTHNSLMRRMINLFYGHRVLHRIAV